MKKVRIEKKYGEWMYEKVIESDMEFPMWKLYNDHGFIDCFCCYNDMIYYIKTGIVI